MAVQVKTKKRRLSQTLAGNEQQVVVKKKLKRKQEHLENDKEKVEMNGVIEKKKKGKKEHKSQQQLVDVEIAEKPTSDTKKSYKLKIKKKTKTDFKFLEFRKKLRGTNFIAEIRNFLQLAQKRRVIAKYLEKRGKPLELVEALERIDKTNVLHIDLICQSLHLLLIEILAHNKQHLNAAEQACRYFLKTHSEVIDSLLNSPQFEHRRTALKLLTAMVCVDAQLGRQLLNTSDILTNSNTIEKLLSHTDKEVNAQESVRKCYIHFILAYLIDGNVLLIQNILERGMLIRALVAGLQFDDHATVCMVLNALRQYVLECAEISKTKKFHVFDEACCKSLASLYDWYGPKVYAQRCKQQMSTRDMQEMVDIAEQDMVKIALHEFMVLLLTSRKNGICFNALKQMNSLHFRQKHNVVPGKVIFMLYKPWMCTKKTELIVEILKSCPELGRQTIRRFSGVVNFMRTLNIEWVAATQFLAKLIDTLKPALLESIQDKITLTDWTNWIKDVCLPIETLVLINSSNVLKSKQHEFRVATTQLLYAMFKQYSNYMIMHENAIKKMQRTGNDALPKFKLDLLNHILVHFPTVEKVLLSLNLTLELNESKEKILEHLEAVLDLMLIICRQNRSVVDKSRLIIKFLELTRPMYSTAEQIITENNVKEFAVEIRIELKAVKIMLALFPEALSPDRPIFQSILRSFITAFVSGEEDISKEAKKLLRQIFTNTGFFNSSDLEIDLWLEALRFVDKQSIQMITSVLTEVLELSTSKSITDEEMQVPKIKDVMNKSNLQQLFKNIEQGLSIEAYVEIVKPSSIMSLIFKGVDIVQPLTNYLEIVCLLLYHYSPHPAEIVSLYKTEFQNFTDYMEINLKNTNQTIQPLPKKNKLISNIPFYGEIQLAILKESTNINELLEKFSTTSANMHLHIIYIQLVLFMVVQLSEQHRLTQAQAELAANIIIASLKQIHETCEEEQLVVEENVVNVLHKMLHYIFAVRLAQLHSVQLFTLNNAAQHNYVHFLCILIEYCNTLPGFSQHSAHFRQKLLNAVAISLENRQETKKHSQQLLESIKLVAHLNLDAAYIVNMLSILFKKLQTVDFYIDTVAYKPSIYYNLVVCLLQQLAALKKAVDSEIIVKKFNKIYINLVATTTNFDIEALEQAFYDYLIINRQYLSCLKLEVFQCIFQARKINKITIKLACLLLERNNDNLWHAEFLQQLPKQLEKRELIYALLQVAFKIQINLSTDLLQIIYAEFKKGLIKSIEKPRKAPQMYREHIFTGIQLIKCCMPASECLDYCQKQLKFDAAEYYQIQLLHAIYNKANMDQQVNMHVHINYLNTNIQLLILDLKQSTNFDLHKLKLYGFVINDCLNNKQIEFVKLQQSQNWLNLCKSCLKIGMQQLDASILNEQEMLQAYEKQAYLLKLLTLLCANIFEDAQETVIAAEIYEMLILHSQFRHILLSRQMQMQYLKTSVLHLWYVLGRKVPKMLKKHAAQILILLGAYGAHLTAADRYALAMLQLYEQYATTELHKYRPFVWGEGAINYYGLQDEHVPQKLTQQEASMEQVMSLWDPQICAYTLENFPVWRKLQTQQQLPEMQFPHPDEEYLQLDPQFGIAEVQTAINDKCYDPAFFVPLMSMCFAPGMYVHPARAVQNGLLGMCITALSAQDADMRLAAASVQMRYWAHFEQHKFAMRELWTQIYVNIQAGLNELRAAWLRYKKVAETPRVPLFATLYVARALQLTTNPTNLLYKELMMHMRLNESFNFQSIPNFNVLFYSKETEHRAFREHIVEIIRHGLKTSADVFLLVMTNTLKVLLGCYGSTTICNLDLTLMLLSIVEKCVKIPASTKLLIEHVGILSWLHSLVISLKFHQFDIMEGVVSIVYYLWYALRANESKFHNFSHLRLRIHELALHIVPHITARIGAKGFSKIVRVLQQTHSGVKTLLTEEQLDRLINCAAVHFAEYIYNIENIRKFGGTNAESDKAYCQKLYEQGAGIEAILSLSNLRSYTISWYDDRKKQKIDQRVECNDSF